MAIGVARDMTEAKSSCRLTRLNKRRTLAEMSTSSAYIPMHGVEYSLTLSRPLR
jgi:hypothetical protein